MQSVVINNETFAKKITLFSPSLLIGFTRGMQRLGLNMVIWVSGGSQEVCQKRNFRFLVHGTQSTRRDSEDYYNYFQVPITRICIFIRHTTYFIRPTIFPKTDNALLSDQYII